MSTAVYHHIEHDPETAISFDKGGLSTEDHEYFVINLGGVTTFCTRQQAQSVCWHIDTYFNSEYLIANPITQEILPA